ncbi:hypothetical protein P9X10_01345 [Bacillus cereus]|nr:hypothetical protein [Bacillus cereus]
MLKLVVNYTQKKGAIEFHSAQLKYGDNETVAFQVNNLRVFQDFLTKTGLELNHPTRSVAGSIIITNEYMFDYNLIIKPFTAMSEVPFNAKYVVTVVDSILLEGWLYVENNTIVIRHPSDELGTEELKRLAFELYKKRGTDISDVPVFLIDYMLDNTYYNVKRGI